MAFNSPIRPYGAPPPRSSNAELNDNLKAARAHKAQQSSQGAIYWDPAWTVQIADMTGGTYTSRVIKTTKIQPGTFKIKWRTGI